MEFKENENLSFEDRIKQVSKEITNYYPEINYELALKISSFTDVITKNIDYNAIFNRYYYLLLNTLNMEVFTNIFKDMINVCNNKITNEVYLEIYNDIILYVNSQKKSFPIISDYYN